MSQPIGQTRWAIAEGYIPAYSNGSELQFTSHETACPIVVQHTRLDSRQAENALLSTIAYASSH